MSVTYCYNSLNSMADYFGNKAKELRHQSTSTVTKIKARELRAEAFAYENAAHILRNTRLTGDQGSNAAQAENVGA